MAQIGDIVQVTHKYQAAGETALNVFYYEITAQTQADEPLLTWLDELSTQWDTGLREIWHTSTISTSIRADNLTNGVEFAEIATGWNGNQAGEPAPSFVAIPVRLNRTTKVTRNGSKRISGITEDLFNGNAVVLSGNQAPGIYTYCATSYLFTDVDGAGNDVQITQRIVGRTKNAQGVYELDLAKVNPIGGVVIGANISTQNSRKV